MSSELTIFESLVKSANQRDSAEAVTQPDEITIRSLLLVLRRRRAIILWTMAVCFFLAVIVCIRGRGPGICSACRVDCLSRPDAPLGQTQHDTTLGLLLWTHLSWPVHGVASITTFDVLEAYA
jgi:hypothetical protein